MGDSRPNLDEEMIPGNHRRPANMTVILGLCLVHFIGDFYVAFVNPLLPLFAEKFSLSLVQVGFIAGLNRLLAFVIQPSVGYLADRYRTRFFVLGGPLLAITSISLVGIAPSYPVLLFFIALGSAGSSMFHPPSAGMVSTYAGPHLGLSLSLFNMGGTMGMGMGPLFISYVVAHYGLSASPFTMIIGLAVVIILFRLVPLPRGEGLRRFGFIGSIKEALGGVWKVVVLIWLFSVLRAFVNLSFLTFLPILSSREGYSLFSIGLIISLFSIGGAIGELVAGHLSDRIGYKLIFYISNSLATLFFCLLLILPGQWILLSSFGAGFSAMATLPLTLAMAQRLAPRGRSMVSSLMMGFAFGTGGMMTPLTGKLADLFSIRPVLAGLAFIPFLTIGFIYLIPEKKLQSSPQGP